jgi:Leucine-rich repeat (LRR) protein
MNDETPRKRSVESLKKEAKRWLAQLRANNGEARARFDRALTNPPTTPTLRDVQHALAREAGFDGWRDLTQSIGRVSIETLTPTYFENAVRALYDAYMTGTPEAMEGHYRYTWHRRAWTAMRTYVQLDLGKRGTSGDDVAITPDDARYLVAQENGFTTWEALMQFVESASSRQGLAVKPVQAFVKLGDVKTGEVRSRSWAEVRAFLDAHERAVLHAHGQITDDALRIITRGGGIESLELGGSKRVTDEGIRHLARLPELRELDLSGTAITDEGLAVLTQLPHLERINLSGTRVTDAGLQHLRGCHELREIHLMWTRTGDEVFRVLAGKPSVRRVASGNLVTDAGLASIAHIPAFRQWMGGEESMGLTSYENAPNQLTLRGMFTDEGMRHLGTLEGLSGLNIDAAELALTARCLEPLISLPYLSWLACDAKDDWMPAIARMPRLRFLGVQDTVAGDEGFVSLSGSRSIEYIWGRRCHNLRRRGFLALANMPKLRSLSVSCLNVDDQGVAALPSFPALRELMPMDVPDAGYRHIARCTQLERLVLMYCRDTTDAATEHVVALPNLRYYFNSYTMITDRTPELLSTMDTLESVSFSKCHMVTNEGVARLARLPQLREVDVSGRQITPAVADAFPLRVKVKIAGE